MSLPKQAFVDAGQFMLIKQKELPTTLGHKIWPENDAITSPEKFEVLYDSIMTRENPEALLETVSDLMIQVQVATSESLANRNLEQVSQLRAVNLGLGKIVSSPGISAGTKAIQEALNEIANKLPDFPKCYAGVADGKFGQKTENAIRSFQSVHDELSDTGKVDGKTLKMLDEVLTRARTINVNNISNIQHDDVLRMIGNGDRFKNECVLTFDDGPDPDSLRVLDALKSANVKGATFFVQGINVKRYPHILRRMVEEGHVIGNHTFDHPNLTKKSAQEIEKQLNMCQGAVNDALGYDYPLKQMRPPYGALNDNVRGVLRTLGLDVMLWQIDTNDWRPENRKNPQKIIDNIFSGSAPVTRLGGLILFHDIHPSTGEILPEVIRRLKSEGIRIATAQSLFEQKYQIA